jgi:uncharacterized protein (UPF0335 family)
MARKSKKEEKSYIVAVKDYEKTMEDISSGKLYVSSYKDEYPEVLDKAKAKVSDMKDVKKLIKMSKQNKKEVRHYWESLISNGYTLFMVTQEKEEPTIEALFNNNTLKFVCKLV